MTKPDLREMSEFFERYLPLEHREGLFLIDPDHSPWHAALLAATPEARVWSYCTVDVDDTVQVLPGHRLVNRVGYVLASVERQHPDEEQIIFQEELAQEP